MPKWFKRERKEEKREEEEGVKKEVKEAVKGVFYGMASHGMVRYMLKTRMYLEHLFMLITLGDMLGFPILPPYYSLKLLPYAIPHIKTWKRSLFRERDVTDLLY